jgi:aryl-alcohol dehydrogenase-like predicted oxidoreductase
MQYSMLGDTGLVVSRLCFGAMSFRAGNDKHAAFAKVRQQEADAMMGRVLDAGINFFDTADVYSGGDSEVMLGAALKHRRSEAVIATKVGARAGAGLTQGGLSARHIHWSVEQSLRRLGTDWIDVYICHREDPLTPIEETLRALDDLVRAGKVRYLGFSNWSAWLASAALELQRANGWAQFTHGQMYYSLLCRDVEQDVVPMMQRYRMGLTVWSPLSGGFLSGKYTRDNLDDPAHRRAGMAFPPLELDQAFKVVDLLRPIAERHAASVVQVALAWVLARPQVTSVLVGASSLAQLDDNLGAQQLQLDAAELATLDAATAVAPRYPGWFVLMSDQAMKAALAGKRGTGNTGER